jgi:hypothetical protein
MLLGEKDTDPDVYATCLNPPFQTLPSVHFPIAAIVWRQSILAPIFRDISATMFASFFSKQNSTLLA